MVSNGVSLEKKFAQTDAKCGCLKLAVTFFLHPVKGRTRTLIRRPSH